MLVENRARVIAAPTPLAVTTGWRTVVTAYLDAATDSPHARRAYQRHLQAAFAWLDVTAVADLTGAQFAACRPQLTNNRLAPASQSQALAAVRAFLHWLGTMGAHRLSADLMSAAGQRAADAVGLDTGDVLADQEGDAAHRG